MHIFMEPGAALIIIVQIIERHCEVLSLEDTWVVHVNPKVVP
jgi:hypothetical protein